MTGGAGSPKAPARQTYPVRIQMRLGFRSATDFDLRNKIILPGNDRNRVTQITFQSDRLVISIEVLAIMTAETTREFYMAKIVWMCCPINLLVIEDTPVVNILKRLNCRRDLFAVTS